MKASGHEEGGRRLRSRFLLARNRALGQVGNPASDMVCNLRLLHLLVLHVECVPRGLRDLPAVHRRRLAENLFQGNQLFSLVLRRAHVRLELAENYNPSASEPDDQADAAEREDQGARARSRRTVFGESAETGGGEEEEERTTTARSERRQRGANDDSEERSDELTTHDYLF